MLADLEFTDRYRTNPPFPIEDLKWFLKVEVGGEHHLRHALEF
jgi:hypothetical protein